MNRKIKCLLNDKGGNYIFPFLWLRGEEEAVLREYMKVIQESNIGAVCVESRPHPDFAGPGWWHDMDIILDEARKRNMKVWILDDSHFPTGYANGVMEAADEELCRQSLVYQVIQCPQSNEDIEIPLKDYQSAAEWKPNLNESYTMDMEKVRQFHDDRILSITAVKVNGNSTEDIIDLTEKTEGQILTFRVPEGKWKIYICQLTRNRGPHRNYINMMNAASCKKLLEAVYEPHYEHYGADFGTTIAGFFSDEPELGNGHLYESGKHIYEMEDQAWSSEVQNTLESRWGSDFRKLLPLLWEQEFADEVKARVRFNYMDTVTRAVEQDFSMQIGNWCRNHGVEYIGHLIEDNNQHTRTGSSLGHYFRGLAGQDMAGIDDIGGQVLPQGEWIGPYGLMGEERNGEFYHYVLGKLASSLAVIDPLKKGRSMCEIFGAYGWEEGVRLEKYLVDHFLVRGINHYVPHAFSAREFPDLDCPPHFYAHGNNPQYRHFGALMQYTNRICELISDGTHIAMAAILYNAEAEWTGNYMNLEKPAMVLADRQIDYDFIPADVFMDKEKFKTEFGSVLIVNGQEYAALIIPKVQFLTAAAAAALVELQKNGFPVLFIDQYPEGICDQKVPLPEELKNYEIVSLENLIKKLDERNIPQIRLEPAQNRVRYLHYREESDCYLLVNEGTENYRGTVHVPETGGCYAYNAWDNRLESIDYDAEEAGTAIHVCIEPGKSLIVVFDDINDTTVLHKSLTDDTQYESITWNDCWKRSICSSKEYPAFRDEKEISLPDTLAEEEPEFSGFVCYEKTYVSSQIPEHLVLVITDAYEGIEVFVNGCSAGIQITPLFRYDVGSMLQIGRNEIRIEAATTLERQMAKIPDPVRMYMGLGEKVPKCPSGINGEVKWEWNKEHSGA